MSKTNLATEEFILQSCLEQFRALPPIQQAHFVARQVKAGDKSALAYDAQVNVTFKTGGHTVYWVQLKSILSRAQAEQIIVQAQAAGHKGERQPLLIMARYVNPSLAELLHQSRVQFIDLAGNASLEHPKGVFIWVLGKRPPKLGPEPLAGAAFGANGTKVLYVLLKDPAKAVWKYREIAQQAGVALGTVSRVLADLKRAGFLEPAGPYQFKLIQKRKLLDRWVESYSERLRPKLALGKFRTPRLELVEVARELERMREPWAVTADIAADLLTDTLKGGRPIIMLDTGLNELTEKLKLMPSKNENLEILHLFSRAALFEASQTRYPIVHPLLIYAELLHSGDDRAREAARTIYERYIAQSIEPA